MQSKQTVWEAPVPSTGFIAEAISVLPRGEVTFLFESDGTVSQGTLGFTAPACWRFTSEAACSAWQIKEVYDTLVEVEHSRWLAKMVVRIAPHRLPDRPLKHYMIYFDSTGAIEVLATGWHFDHRGREGRDPT